MTQDPILTLPLASTGFLALSANPVGFNHFAAAEWMLRAHRRWKHIVLIPSNGHHPDPTKADATTPASTRLRILRTAIAEVDDPERSFLARAAQRAGERLRVGPGSVLVWEWEFAHDRAVTAAETVSAIAAAHPSRGPIHWITGSDLIVRMGQSAIFSDADVADLAGSCHFAILERKGNASSAALRHLAARVNRKVAARAFSLTRAPEWLAPFLELSSTAIRHAAEAGDAVTGMVPVGAARQIEEGAVYAEGEPAVLRSTPAGAGLRPQSRLAARCEELRAELDALAAELAEELTAAGARGAPHSLSIAEASVGGLLAHAFAGRNGASKFLAQSRFVYDERAKAALLGSSRRPPPAVSQAMAKALAKAMRAQAGTDFAIAETGMAGPPDGSRRSMKNGLCHVAVATPRGVHGGQVWLNPFLTRREHQLGFAIAALTHARELMAGGIT